MWDYDGYRELLTYFGVHEQCRFLYIGNRFSYGICNGMYCEICRFDFADCCGEVETGYQLLWQDR